MAIVKKSRIYACITFQSVNKCSTIRDEKPRSVAIKCTLFTILTHKNAFNRTSNRNRFSLTIIYRTDTNKIPLHILPCRFPTYNSGPQLSSSILLLLLFFPNENFIESVLVTYYHLSVRSVSISGAYYRCCSYQCIIGVGDKITHRIVSLARKN